MLIKDIILTPMSLSAVAGLLPLLFVAFLVLHEPIWLLWYRYAARRHKCSMPRFIEKSFPLGIQRTMDMIKTAKSYTLLEVQYDRVFNKFKARTYLRQAPLQYQIFTIEPENIKTILATKFNDFGLGARFHTVGKVFGQGIFTLSGNGWKQSRSMLRPQFTKDQVCRIDQISSHAAELIKEMNRAMKVDQFIDVQHYFHKLTLDTATEFLFGESCESLNPENQSCIVARDGSEITAEQFVESYNFLLNYAFKRTLSSKVYWLFNSKEFRDHKKRAQSYIDYYVDKALYATSFAAENSIAEKDAAAESSGIYVFSLEMAKVTRDPVTIRDQIFNILIAGRDTTAATLSFAIHFLARNPDVFNKLREEVLDHFGTKEEQRPLSFELLKQAPYLKQVINEVLRLAPVLPLNFRTAVRDTTLPIGGGPEQKDPIFVPKGTAVYYSIYMVHRDIKYWGPDAHEFNPNRWENLKLDNVWAFLPFNGGPRICLGQQFALTELSLTLVRLLQEYSKIEMGPDFPESPRFSTTLTAQHAPPGVVVRFS
uniref:Cytochrome P450 52-M1 n=2 Tax=Trichomonascaceae TaxID=410830 RepID=CP52M_STABO|nr:RecName: Full=Cytochrome P450 52-M1; Short=CYP52-M1; AltName: Full=Cytochrome P450 monooxygenase CYP52-M1 [Starmerella bombicola]ACD75398.1 cytochrome P450 monooxygenase CYP52-M1 [Starmerella bombicola]